MVCHSRGAALRRVVVAPQNILARDSEKAFQDADPEHFRFQTEAPFVSQRERELLMQAFMPLGQRALDIGCGEGATLLHLGAQGAVGVDLFEDKIRFAKEAVPACHFEVGSIYDLPFPAGAFDHVLLRDVVHHLDEPARAVEECARVLETGGRLDLLEPCRYNPLIALHALTHREERGELRSTVPFLRGLIERHFRIEAVTRLQPLPIHRVVFHPRMGSPQLADNPTVCSVVSTVEALAERLVPRVFWTYIHVRAQLR